MIKETTILCDRCGAVIAHLAALPNQDLGRLHNLCPKCFADLAASKA